MDTYLTTIEHTTKELFWTRINPAMNKNKISVKNPIWRQLFTQFAIIRQIQKTKENEYIA